MQTGGGVRDALTGRAPHGASRRGVHQLPDRAEALAGRLRARLAANLDEREVFVGEVDGSGTLTKVGEDEDPDTYNDETPDISGSRVVWTHVTQDARGAFDADIHTRVLGGPVRTVEGAPGFQLTPSVDGNLIAWEDDRATNPHVWAKRLGGRSLRVSPRFGTPGNRVARMVAMCGSGSRAEPRAWSPAGSSLPGRSSAG